MGQKIDKIDEAYFARTEGNTTLSGIPLKKVYTPENAPPPDYNQKLGDPGSYPYTRGVYADMFQGRYWSKREICGYASPEATNLRLKALVQEGASALNAIGDFPTNVCIDSDHPLAEGVVGAQGVPVCSYRDMEALTEGIPMDKVSFMLTFNAVISLPAYVGVARQKGIPLESLRGTSINTPGLAGCVYGPRALYYQEIPWRLRLYMDHNEYAYRNLPLWNPINVNGYATRESGGDAAHEIAISFTEAQAYIDILLERGLSIEQIAPRFSFTYSCGMDFFEEIAKFRAARRVWAGIIREKYGAEDPRLGRLKYHTNTAGESLQHQQPLNNVVRVAVEALAAVIGGTQSLQTCSYDEGIDIPTAEAQRLALRTQQIIAHESGVTNVVDPLGGSYYIEELTDKLEEKAREIIKQVEEQDGQLKAMCSGWIEDRLRQLSFQQQQKVENGERVIVGVNAYNDESDEGQPVESFQLPEGEVERHLDNLRELRSSRHSESVKRELNKLGEAASREDVNLTEQVLSALQAGATSGEIAGFIRMAYGYPYDIMHTIDCPF